MLFNLLLKYCVFLIGFRCFIAIETINRAQEEKPFMYYDGTVWRTMKPGRNITVGVRNPRLFNGFKEYSRARHLSLSKELNSFRPVFKATAKPLVTAVESIIDNLNKPQYDEYILAEGSQKKTKLEPEDTTVVINYTSLIKEVLPKKPRSADRNTTTSPKEWIQFMLRLSNTLKQLAERENRTYYELLQKTRKGTIKHPKENSRRTVMGGVDDLLAMLADGIEIDNGSDSSDELSKVNRNFLRKMTMDSKEQDSKVPEMNGSGAEIRDTDNGDFISDGGDIGLELPIEKEKEGY